MSLPSKSNLIQKKESANYGTGNENWDLILMNYFHVANLNDMNLRHAAVNLESYELVRSCEPEICENYLRQMLKSLKKVCSQYNRPMNTQSNTENLLKMNWYLISKNSQKMNSEWPYNPMILEDPGVINIDFKKINGNVVVMFLCYVFIENIPRMLFGNECDPDIFPTSPFYNGRRKGESPKMSLRGRLRFRSMYLALTHLIDCEYNNAFNANVQYIIDQLKFLYRSEELYSIDDGFDIKCGNEDADSIYEFIETHYSNFEADHPGEQYTYAIRELLDHRKDDPITKSAVKR